MLKIFTKVGVGTIRVRLEAKAIVICLDGTYGLSVTTFF